MNLHQCAALLQDRHFGAVNAVKGPELAKELGVSNRDLREIVNTLRRDGVPIASNSDGYFYAETAQEVRATLNHMKHRIRGITAAIRGLERSRALFIRTSRGGGDSP